MPVCLCGLSLSAPNVTNRKADSEQGLKRMKGFCNGVQTSAKHPRVNQTQTLHLTQETRALPSEDSISSLSWGELSYLSKLQDRLPVKSLSQCQIETQSKSVGVVLCFLGALLPFLNEKQTYDEILLLRRNHRVVVMIAINSLVWKPSWAFFIPFLLSTRQNPLCQCNQSWVETSLWRLIPKGSSVWSKYFWGPPQSALCLHICFQAASVAVSTGSGDSACDPVRRFTCIFCH